MLELFFFASAPAAGRSFPHPRTEPLLCLTGKTEVQQSISHKVIIRLKKKTKTNKQQKNPHKPKEKNPTTKNQTKDLPTSQHYREPPVGGSSRTLNFCIFNMSPESSLY